MHKWMYVLNACVPSLIHGITDKPFPDTLTRETFDDAVEFSSARLAFPYHWLVT